MMQASTQTVDYVIRAFRWDDLEGLVSLLQATGEADGEIYFPTLEQLRHEYESPMIDPERDNVVVTLPDGTLIGWGSVEIEDEGRVWADGEVHPAYRRRGIGTALLAFIDEKAAAAGLERVSAEHPVFLQHVGLSTSTENFKLLERAGYHYVRSFYTMQIDFDAPIEASPLPDGLELRPFDQARDLQAVYEAHQDSFQDHYGFHSDPFEEWQHFMVNRPEYDGTLWRIAWDGDQIAGIAINRSFGAADPGKGWVGTLGVRRAYRKRGLGGALLRHSLVGFQARGFHSAGLGVDANSLTNAVALYENAGMYVRLKRDIWRKMVRGDEADIGY